MALRNQKHSVADSLRAMGYAILREQTGNVLTVTLAHQPGTNAYMVVWQERVFGDTDFQRATDYRQAAHYYNEMITSACYSQEVAQKNGFEYIKPWLIPLPHHTN